MQHYRRMVSLITIPAFLLASCVSTRVIYEQKGIREVEKTESNRIAGNKQLIIEQLNPLCVKVVERTDVLEERIDYVNQVDVTKYGTASLGAYGYVQIIYGSCITFGLGLLVLPIYGYVGARKAVKKCNYSGSIDMDYNCKVWEEKTIVGREMKKKIIALGVEDQLVTTGSVTVQVGERETAVPITTSGVASVSVGALTDLDMTNKSLVVKYLYGNASLQTTVSQEDIEAALSKIRDEGKLCD